ncbi:transglutaminase-like domain-containing protein [Conyzicola nivalis]|uniref:Cysteine protease n=1 Tax=Conyzicola nivalis TaxID=1477021 RepID=A0A916SQM9_9MICO|nr:transglutaminase-like domain-containing protein [Conyzicola nivalis]GGB11573.1 cysteine protease [Conyzicola nivalis]
MRLDRDALLRLAWDLSYIVAGVAIATALAWPIYESPRVVLVGVVATVLGIGLVLLRARLKRPVWTLALAVVAGYLVVVVPLAIPSALGSPLRVLRGLGDGVVGVVVGWKQVLTLTLPLGEYQAVLVPFLVVILLGTVLATSFVVRGTRLAVAAVPVVMLMSVFGLVFGSSDTGQPLRVGAAVIPAPREVLLAILLVVVSLVWLVGRARMARARALRIVQASTSGVRQGSHSRWVAARRQALGVVLVVGAVLGGLAIAPAASGWVSREALREAIDPLLIVQKQASPLAGYRAWFEADNYDRTLFTVEGDTTGIDRVRIATLGDYDGEVFRAGGQDADPLFTRLAGGGSGEGTPLTVTIGDGFAGVWVPVPGTIDAAPVFSGERAEDLTDAFYVSRGDAAAVDVAERTGGGNGLEVGDTYRVLAQPDAEVELGPDRGGEPLVSENDYAEMADWVEAQEVPRTGDGLAELFSRLRDRGYLSHSLSEGETAAPWIADLQSSSGYAFQSSYAGHSVARIEQIFADLADQQRIAGASDDEALLVAAVGDDEQFATAAAVLARYLGFESRVVVGTRLASDDEAPSVAPCADGVCTGANVTAWVEVRAADGAWATFDVSPQFAVTPIDVTEGEQLPENPTVPEQSRTDVLDPPPAQRDDSEGSTVDDEVASDWFAAILPVLLAVGTGLLAVFLLLLPLLFLFVIKGARRRRRRDEPVPEVRVVGAWDELVDTYLDHGFSVPAGATRKSVAEAVGRAPALALAATVDAAVFAEHPPTRGASDAAWTIVDDERSRLIESSTLRDRVRASVSLASFLRHVTPRAVLEAARSLFRQKESPR